MSTMKIPIEPVDGYTARVAVIRTRSLKVAKSVAPRWAKRFGFCGFGVMSFESVHDYYLWRGYYPKKYFVTHGTEVVAKLA